MYVITVLLCITSFKKAVLQMVITADRLEFGNDYVYDVFTQRREGIYYNSVEKIWNTQ